MALQTSHEALAAALARQWFGGFLIPRDTGDSWLVEGLAVHLVDKFLKHLMGDNEIRYRRGKEEETVSLVDNGDTVPPLASTAARLWHGGRRAGKSTAGPPQPLPPQIYELLQWKAKAVVGMLERRIGEDAMASVLKQVISMQTNEKKMRAEKLKEKKHRQGRDQLPLAGMHESREEGSVEGDASVGFARWLQCSEFLNLCRNVANLSRGEVVAFAERWIYGCGCPQMSVGFAFRRKRNSLEFAVKLEGSALAAHADRMAVERGRSHKTSVTVRVQEAEQASDHAVSLGTVSWQLMDLPLHTKPKDRRTVARAKSKLQEATSVSDSCAVA